MPRPGPPKYISRIISKKHNPGGRDENIAWLNERWEGLDWIPADVQAVLEKAKIGRNVLRGLKAISELAMEKNIRLTSLWEPGGCLRDVVQAGATTKNGQEQASQTLAPFQEPSAARLPVLDFNSCRSRRRQHFIASASANTYTGSKKGADCKEEAPKDEAVASQLRSLSLSPPTKQRHPSPVHDTSTEHELRDPPRGTKRLVEDNEEELLNPPPKKSQRVAVKKALWSTSPYQMGSGHPELDAALAAKDEAEKALLDLVHRNGSMAVSQAQKVQTRLRKLEAEETFHQLYARLHRPSQPLVGTGNVKRPSMLALYEHAQKEA
ncbi:hypothetical protein H9Q72_010817 [Fusarium xylarioides]|uniref:Uncharacterized protein n=1 Tax=Fusarium xylarioides TaxID=221167 RepID=A0A9P7KXL6_9HYPO|nr:hypothetical protein H9Q72_010817 [Fusarium xylarioides]